MPFRETSEKSEKTRPLARFTTQRRDILALIGSLGVGSSVISSATAQTQDLRGNITEIEADPSAGFDWPYFLFVPDKPVDHPRPILIDPTNNPSTTDDFAEVREAGRSVAEYGISRDISEELGLPLLVPMFPRPRSDPVDSRYQIQSLDTDTMHLSSGSLERVDLQLISMVEHARQQLTDVSFPVKETVLLNGFSASGNFVNRFTALQPDIVDAVTAGAVNGTPVLPITEAKGHTLNYQIGVADIEELTGTPFQKDSWTDVDQLVYMGGEDENDTIPYPNLWDDTQREIALDVYGENMQEERMPYSAQVYAEAGANASVVVYPNMGHGYQPKIKEKLTEHHRKHAGDWHASVIERPLAGDKSVSVAASVPTDASADEYEIQVRSLSQGDISAETPRVAIGETVEVSLSLTSAVTLGEQLSVGVVPSGDDFSEAKSSNSTVVVGDLDFVSEPVGGDKTVEVAYQLDANYAPEATPQLRVDTQSGGSSLLTDLQPGDQDTTTVTLAADNGIPFMEDREVSLVIVDNDQVGALPLAEHSVTVDTPDEPAVALDLKTDRVVERGEIITAETELQGLGGGTADAEVTYLVNGEQVSQETASIRTGETTTTETTIRTDGYDTAKLDLEVQYRDTSTTATTVLADIPAAGKGTNDDPFQVTNASELAYLTQNVEAAYELQSDIDLSPFDNFAIIGDKRSKFTGSFDGNGYEIQHLTIEAERDTYDGVGLFGGIKDATISDIHLRDVNITGKEFVGSLVGVGWATGTIERVSISGTVTGDSNVGGLIGGTQTGQSESSDLQISQIASNVDVRGETWAGGIIGQAAGDTIRNVYARGQISAQYGGGLVGASYFGTTIEMAYAATPFDGEHIAPIDDNPENNTVNHVYWDMDTTGKSDAYMSNAIGLAKDEITGESAPRELTGFDFDSIWTVRSENPQYPVLQWESESQPEQSTGEHPSGVSQEVWDVVTSQNDPPDELTFQDLIDAIDAYQADGTINNVDVSFQDLLDLIEWYN